MKIYQIHQPLQPAGFDLGTWVRRTYRLGGLIGSVDPRPANELDDRLAESPV